jgi:hypothetical protein
MITLQKHCSKQELAICINIYADYNDNSFIAVNRRKSLLQLTDRVNQGQLFYTIKDGDVIVGWVLAEQLKHPFSTHSFLQQSFYVTSLSGIKAARAVILAHEELIRQAELRRIDLVISVGSFYDEQNVFTKILEKRGWSRRGHTAIWKTSHYKDTADK